MPVLPNIPDSVKFEAARVDSNAKVVDRPNAFHNPSYVKTNKRTVGYQQMTIPKFSCGLQSSTMTAGNLSATTSASVNRMVKPVRFQNSPANTNPLLGTDDRKEFTLPMRGRVGMKSQTQHQDPNASHLARRRCNGQAFERQFGSHAVEKAFHTEQSDRNMPITPSNNAHKGKRIVSHTTNTKEDKMVQPEALRATSRYALSRRFDMPQMINPRLEEKQPVLVTGREVFRRTNTTLEGVFYPAFNGNRSSSIQPPPYHVD